MTPYLHEVLILLGHIMTVEWLDLAAFTHFSLICMAAMKEKVSWTVHLQEQIMIVLFIQDKWYMWECINTK